jgi:hypothetical protein
MIGPSHSSENQPQTSWLPPWRALFSLCWRLSILLCFFIGTIVSALLNHWWIALACIIGFIVIAFIIRRVSPAEHEKSGGDSIIFL